MTDDLIKRLRKDNNPSEYGDLIDEAADRIEELTKQRDELLSALKFQFSLSVGLLHSYTDEKLPDEIKEQSLNLIDDMTDDVSVRVMLERSANAIANVKGQP